MEMNGKNNSKNMYVIHTYIIIVKFTYIYICIYTLW